MGEGKLIFFFIFLLFSIFIFFPNTVLASQDWTKYTGNPVLDVGYPGSWDDNDVDSPAVIFDGNIYKMWYGGHDGSNWRIGYAISPDGVNWTKYENPVVNIDPFGSWEKDAHEPVVIYEDGVYKMWYTSGNFTPTIGTEKWRIRYATSPDGINWTKYPDPVLRGDPNGWDKEGVAHPYVMRDGTIYKMWYPGRDVGDIWRMGYATSPDGINWSKTINPLSGFNDPWVGGPSVLKINDSYSIWYHNSREIEVATSSDGILWERSTENPVLSRDNSGFDNYRLIAPFVIQRSDVYQMWYTGYDGRRWQIGYASTGVIPTPTPTPSFLPVPYFSQRDPLWKADEYDHASKWVELGEENTIEWWGCALTSGAMVARYFGVDKTPYNEELTPGTLNKWMQDQNDANFRNGAMNWQLLSRMSAKTASLFGTPKLDLSLSKMANNFSKLDEILLQSLEGFPGLPGVLQVAHPTSPNGKHFVVAKGRSGITYGLNDPYDQNKNLLSASPYNNNFGQLVWYEPTHSNLSTIFLVVDKNVDIKILYQNSFIGEQFDLYPLGADGGNSGESGEVLKMLYLDKPTSGNYSIALSTANPQPQSYRLDVYLYDRNAEVKMATFVGWVGPGDQDNIFINFDLENVQNSHVSRPVTFATLRDDINLSYLFGWIDNDGIKDSLLAKVNSAEKASQREDKKTGENILNALLNEIEAQKGKQLNPLAYHLLKGDIEILLS